MTYADRPSEPRQTLAQAKPTNRKVAAPSPPHNAPGTSAIPFTVRAERIDPIRKRVEFALTD